MRLSLLVATLSLVSLAACSSAPTNAPSTPVQANQAQPAAQGDASANAEQPRPRKKYLNTGSRLPTSSPDADPSLGMPASGLNNATTNASGGGPK